MQIVQLFWRTYSQSHVPFFAAALAYYALFSLMPLLFLLAGGFGWLLRGDPALEQAARNRLAELTLLLFPTQPDLAQTLLAFLSQGAASFTLGGLLVLLWTSSNFFAALSYSLGIIFKGRELVLGPRPRLRGLRGRLAGLLAPLLLGVALIVLVFAGVALSFVVRYVPALQGGVEWGLPVLSAWALFYLVYRFLPLYPPTHLLALLAAAFAAVAWEGMRLGLPALLPRSQYEVLYGPIASFLLGMLGFYLTMWILLVGAVLAQTYRSSR